GAACGQGGSLWLQWRSRRTGPRCHLVSAPDRDLGAPVASNAVARSAGSTFVRNVGTESPSWRARIEPGTTQTSRPRVRTYVRATQATGRCGLDTVSAVDERIAPAVRPGLPVGGGRQGRFL